jgi:hypothetical protein
VRYMVYFEVPIEVGNRIDFEEGGPGPIFGHIMERFAPDAVYSQAGMRAAFMVAELDEAQMTELMVVLSKKLGTYPEFTPIMSAEATMEVAAKAIIEAKKAP